MRCEVLLALRKTSSLLPIRSRQVFNCCLISSIKAASFARRNWAPTDFAFPFALSLALCAPPCFRRVVYRWKVLLARTTTSFSIRPFLLLNLGTSEITDPAKWPPPTANKVQVRLAGSVGPSLPAVMYLLPSLELSSLTCMRRSSSSQATSVAAFRVADGNIER